VNKATKLIPVATELPPKQSKRNKRKEAPESIKVTSKKKKAKVEDITESKIASGYESDKTEELSDRDTAMEIQKMEEDEKDEPLLLRRSSSKQKPTNETDKITSPALSPDHKKDSSFTSDKTDPLSDTEIVQRTKEIAETELPDLDRQPSEPSLPIFFENCNFCIIGNLDNDTLRLIKRYVTAYGGVISTVVTQYTTYIITDEWKSDLNDYIKQQPSLKILLPSWVIDCHKQQKLIDASPYILGINIF